MNLLNQDEKKMIIENLELFKKHSPDANIQLINILIREAKLLPVSKECLTCIYWRGMCEKYNATPPQEVQKVGCVSYQYEDLPF